MIKDPKPSRSRCNPGQLLLLLLAISGTSAGARELIVHGNVVEVQPITSNRQIAEARASCHAQPAGSDRSIADLLAWDLRAGCPTVYRTEASVTGYRVVYEWDGRTHTRIMREPPGDTLALRVRVD